MRVKWKYRFPCKFWREHECNLDGCSTIRRGVNRPDCLGIGAEHPGSEEERATGNANERTAPGPAGSVDSADAKHNKLETIANMVAVRLEAVTTAVQQGAKDSAEITSQITSQAQSAMSNELKNTREQITQIQQQLGQVQESGHLMHDAATRLENILGGTKDARQLRRNHVREIAGRLPGTVAILQAIPLSQRRSCRRRDPPARQENHGHRFEISAGCVSTAGCGRRRSA